eukprot:s22_g15.t1
MAATASVEEVTKKVESLTTEDSKGWEPMAFPEDRIEHVRKCFDAHPEAKSNTEGQKTLQLKLLHQILFSQEERMEYSLKDFESDAAAVLKDVNDLSWADVEKFMAENL